MSLFESLKKPNFLFDSHCHFNDSAYDSKRDTLLENAQDSGVLEIFDICVNRASIESSAQLDFPNIKRFAGIDPEISIPGSHLFETLELTDAYLESTFNYLDSKLASGNFYGVGESGLDFYWLEKNEESTEVKEKSKISQEKLFRVHLELSEKYSFPISIHSRNAEQRCLEIASEYNTFGFFHSFTGDYNVAEKIRDLGYGIGVNGIATYKSAEPIREMIAKLVGKSANSPEDFYKKGIYFETDGPYLNPAGAKGNLNEPENIALIFEYLCNYL